MRAELKRFLFGLGVAILLLTGDSLRAIGQGAFVPFNDYSYHLLDRYSILNKSVTPFFTGFKPIQRNSIIDLNFLGNGGSAATMDPMHYSYFTLDNLTERNRLGESAEVFWRRFYQNDHAFYAFRDGSSFFQIDPVLGFSGGKADDRMPFQNTRGFTLRGSIDGKIGFYSYITENQIRFPEYYREFVDARSAIPGYGFYKPFGDGAYDFFNARGYVTFSPVKPVQVLFGHDKLFVGNGYRSLIWSDHGKEHLMLRLQTQIGKIRYYNVFSELADLDYLSGSGDGIQKKYSAFHYLGLDLKPGVFNLGFFEQILFQRLDSSGLSRGYDVNYLNPIIFYRAIEHGLNSSDNAILGMDFKWNIRNRYSVYGQLVLDEFVKKEMFDRSGWWANKWAVQTGAKWINAFNVKNLDMQLEANWVRPYTYSHSSEGITATHYNQALAHPLGANFSEQLLVVRYQPLPKWNARFLIMNANRGRDSSAFGLFNYGSDITRNYSPANRPRERGIHIGDGVSEHLQIFDMLVSYQFFHNAFWDVRFIYRRSDSGGALNDSNTMFFSTGLRLNLDLTRYDF